MARAIIIAGGNVGEMEPRLKTAGRLVARSIGRVVASSGVHKSDPWGFNSKNRFSNQVLVIDTALSPRELLAAIQSIESALGRDRKAESAQKEKTGERYIDRTMDIDILFYGDEVLNDPDLVIPHPMITQREFVLTPLCEVAPDLVHPALKKKISTLNDRTDFRADAEECNQI